MAPTMPNTNSLEVAELEAVFKILEASPDGGYGGYTTPTLAQALERFLHAYEIVNAATHMGVEETRTRLEKK